MKTAFKTTLQACAAATFILLAAGAGSADASISGGSGTDTTLEMDYNGAPGTALTDFIFMLGYPDFPRFEWFISFPPEPKFAIDAGSSDTLTFSSLDFSPPETVGATYGTVLGVVTDANGDDHVTIAMDPTIAAAIGGHDWSELFPNTDEAALAQELTDLTDVKCGNLFDCFGEYIDVNDFAVNALSGMADPNNPGQTLSGYFLTPGGFDFVSFSGAAVVGTGRSFNTPIGGVNVPEPSAWTMLILGFGALGRAARRRRAVLA